MKRMDVTGLALAVLVAGGTAGQAQQAALTAEQRRVLETIASSDAVWNGINITYQLAMRDFPSTREELRHYLGER